MLATIEDWQRHQAGCAALTWVPWASLCDLKPNPAQLAEAVRLTEAAVTKSTRLRRDPSHYIRSTLRHLVRG